MTKQFMERADLSLYVPKILLLYWGRQGVNSLLHEIVDALDRRSSAPCLISLSNQNLEIDRFLHLGERLIMVDTFRTGYGALRPCRIRTIRRQLFRAIRAHGITDVITVMPHIWSSFVVSQVRAAGARYHTILHDTRRHPGDGTGFVLPLLLRDARLADIVFTLSENVTTVSLQLGVTKPDRIVRLFHPALGAALGHSLRAPIGDEPWRLLFLGRILEYKGLPLLIEAVERLRAHGRSVTLSVYGKGPLGAAKEKLIRLKADVKNCWLDESEISAALSSHHAVVMSHIESSQSGIAALASGAGIPVVATPVGGLKEQVHDGKNGLLAARVDSEALSDALVRLMDTPGLHASLTRNIERQRAAISPDVFVETMLSSLRTVS